MADDTLSGLLDEVLKIMESKYGVEATGKTEFDTKGVQSLFEGIPHPLKGIPSAIRVVGNGMKMLGPLELLENICFLRQGLGMMKIMSDYEESVADETFLALNTKYEGKLTEEHISPLLPKESPFVDALSLIKDDDKAAIDKRIFLDINLYARLRESWLSDINILREHVELDPTVLLVTNISIRNCAVDEEMPSIPHTEIGDIPELTHMLIACRETTNLMVPITDLIMLSPSQQVPEGFERIGSIPSSKNSLLAQRGPMGITELVLCYGEPPEGYHTIQLPKSCKKDFMGRIYLCWLIVGEELPVPPTEEELRLMEEQRMEEARKELLRQRSQQLAELEYNIQEARERNAKLQLDISRVIREQDESKERDEDKHPVEMQRRYEKLLQQWWKSTTDLEQLRLKYQSQAMELQTRLDDKTAKSEEIKDYFRDFKKEIIRAAENSRTGKAISRKIIEQFDQAEQKKDAEVEKVRITNIKMRMLHRKVEKSMKEKDELAEGLHLIDFEQLKIENQTLNERIEERNEELQKFRKKMTKTVQVLTHVKEKLHFVKGENEIFRKDLARLDAELTMQRDKLTTAKRQRERLRSQSEKLKEQRGFTSNTLLVNDFEHRKRQMDIVVEKIHELKERHHRLTLSL